MWLLCVLVQFNSINWVGDSGWVCLVSACLVWFLHLISGFIVLLFNLVIQMLVYVNQPVYLTIYCFCYLCSC